MCFIKTINKSFNVTYSQIQTKFRQFDDEFPLISNNNFSQNMPIMKSKSDYQFHNKSSNHLNNSLIFSLLSQHLTRNSESLKLLNQKISNCENQLDKMIDNFIDSSDNYQKNKNQLIYENPTSISLQQMLKTGEEKSQNPLINKIFGQKTYKYKLCLSQTFSTQIYKQRNIKINISLKNHAGQVIKNANIINLCFALVDDNGKWINSNRVGDPMIKGKTQAELYHGQAEFNKIYTKDISRTFLNGRVNILIYNQPSTLIYSGQTSQYEQYISENNIEPLIIEGIVIKAKKKY